jgi:hypothetical protein
MKDGFGKQTRNLPPPESIGTYTWFGYGKAKEE